MLPTMKRRLFPTFWATTSRLLLQPTARVSARDPAMVRGILLYLPHNNRTDTQIQTRSLVDRTSKDSRLRLPLAM